MSAVAGIAKEKGFEVEGSDAKDIYSPSKDVLDKYAIPYHVGYAAENLQSADLVITTSAVDQSNPEVAKALEQKIPIVSFAELLAEFAKDKQQILVVGTHGKGTTSGLLAYALSVLRDASFFVGAVLTDLKTNYHYGKGEYFIIEGDEYKTNFNDNRPKFSFFGPKILLINNIEHDHPDLYPDLESYKKVFRELAEDLPESATIIYNVDDRNVVEVVKNARARKIGFGTGLHVPGAKEMVVGGASLSNGVLTGVWFQQGDAEPQSYHTKLPGSEPYLYDYIAALAVLSELGFKSREIEKLVEEYSGIQRRYQIIYDGKVTIIDDYAHHATAAKLTLEATRKKYPGRRIVAFFEPHTYSRTKETLPQLAQAFGAADLAYIAEVYPAREQKLPSSITGEEVVAAIAQFQKNVRYVKDKQQALAQADIREGDVVVIMAVGSFNTLAYDLKDKVNGGTYANAE